MASDPKNDENNLEITFDEFSDYLNSFNNRFTCPICQERDWTLAVPSLVEYQDHDRLCAPSLMTISIDNPAKETKLRRIAFPLKAFALAIMECSNCGFMYNFSLSKVKENVNTKDYKTPSDDSSED